MRAMRLYQFGGRLVPAEIPIPEPENGEVRIKVEAVGVNFADLLMMAGTYQERPQLPFSPGMELCGTIEQANGGVSSLMPGTRVVAYVGHGGLAEYCCVPETHCIKISNDMPTADAAGFLIAYGTSHVALHHRAKLSKGERLLVLGAGGGIGLTAVELGKIMGAEVVAAARGDRKLKAARRAGADHVIDTDSGDLRTAVKELGGADVVYDPVGGEQFKTALRCVNPEARLLPIGFASGDVPHIPANILLVKNLSVIGVYWGGYGKFRPEVISNSARSLLRLYDEGRLSPRIGNVLPIEDTNLAFDLLRQRQAIGKVVISIGPKT